MCVHYDYEPYAVSVRMLAHSTACDCLKHHNEVLCRSMWSSIPFLHTGRRDAVKDPETGVLEGNALGKDHAGVSRRECVA